MKLTIFTTVSMRRAHKRDRKRRERERVSNFSSCVVIVALVVYLVVARSWRCCDRVSLRRLKDEKQRNVFRKNYAFNWENMRCTSRHNLRTSQGGISLKLSSSIRRLSRIFDLVL